MVFALHEARLWRLPLPQFHRQVPRTWQRFRASGVVCLYGAALGAGVGTRIPSAIYYVVIGWIMLFGRLDYGILVMTVFGVARALPVVALSSFWEGVGAGDTVIRLYNMEQALRAFCAAIMFAVGVLLWKPLD